MSATCMLCVYVSRLDCTSLYEESTIKDYGLLIVLSTSSI